MVRVPVVSQKLAAAMSVGRASNVLARVFPKASGGRTQSVLVGKGAGAVLKKDDKDVEKIPPLSHRTPKIPASYRYIYPEFMPEAKPIYRNALCEKLARRDMLRRREVLDIPEFYVGSVLAVTFSDKHAPTKTSRFVGICIWRGHPDLLHGFILRNVVDGEGVEIQFNLYNPTIRKIQVLKLERRLDEELFYLRDAAKEHSTFPFDMDATPHPEGAPVPLNDVVIKLNPLPWKTRWELYQFHGCTYNEKELVYWKKWTKAKTLKPFEYMQYDLMARYRKLIPLEEQEEMFKDVYDFDSAQLQKRRDAN